MKRKQRIGIIGLGTIGSYVLEAVLSGEIENTDIGLILVRSEQSKGIDLIEKYNLEYTTDAEDLLKSDLDIVVETACHQALLSYGVKILKAGIDLITLSVGVLSDTSLLNSLIVAAKEGNAIFQVPSGAIGGLDALQTALIAGVDNVVMTTRKAPIEWAEIPYVAQLGIDLENMNEEALLFEGPAAEAVIEFPKNLNIAAALSLAGIGFEKTVVRIVADPKAEFCIHEIAFKGTAGKVKIVMENTPLAEEPKSTYMACFSAIAALKRIRAHCRIGT
ncbi:MAG: aspartate dehydrogenase [Sphaerochaetaceae bacterium]